MTKMNIPQPSQHEIDFILSKMLTKNRKLKKDKALRERNKEIRKEISEMVEEFK